MKKWWVLTRKKFASMLPISGMESYNSDFWHGRVPLQVVIITRVQKRHPMLLIKVPRATNWKVFTFRPSFTFHLLRGLWAKYGFTLQSRSRVLSLIFIAILYLPDGEDYGSIDPDKCQPVRRKHILRNESMSNDSVTRNYAISIPIVKIAPQNQHYCDRHVQSHWSI